MRCRAEARFWNKVQLCDHMTAQLPAHVPDRWCAYVVGGWCDHRVARLHDPDVACGVCCWPWHGSTNAHGYGRTRYVFGAHADTYAHRVAWAFMHQGTVAPAGYEVTHEPCDNPPCCNPSHLVLAPHAHHQARMAQTGRANRQGVPRKLSVAKVQRMRELMNRGLSQREIARVMDVSQPMVSKVLTGQAWGIRS